MTPPYLVTSPKLPSFPWFSNHRNPALSVLLGVVAWSLFAGLSAQAETAPLAEAPTAVNPAIERDYAIAPGAVFELKVAAADVRVRRADGDKARVRLTLSSNDSTPPRHEWVEHEVSASRVHLELRAAKADGSGLGARLRRVFTSDDNDGVKTVTLDLPAAVKLHVETGAGDVDITGLADGGFVATGAGDVRVRDMAGSLEVRSGAGDVDVSSGDGQLEIETGAGDVRARLSGGAVSINTGAGDVKLEIERATSPVNVTTGAGDASVTIASGGFELKASTPVGDLQVDGVGQSSGGDHDPSAQVSRRVGSGGPDVNISTGVGDIEIRTAGSRQP